MQCILTLDKIPKFDEGTLKWFNNKENIVKTNEFLEKSKEEIEQGIKQGREDGSMKPEQAEIIKKNFNTMLESFKDIPVSKHGDENMKQYLFSLAPEATPPSSHGPGHPR